MSAVYRHYCSSFYGGFPTVLYINTEESAQRNLISESISMFSQPLNSNMPCTPALQGLLALLAFPIYKIQLSIMTSEPSMSWPETLPDSQSQ